MKASAEALLLGGAIPRSFTVVEKSGVRDAHDTRVSNQKQ
jgi:hypothetical protein